jgi:dihydroneopterin aldolase
MCGQNARLMNDIQDGSLHYMELSNTLIHNLKEGIVLLVSKDIPKSLNFCLTNFNWLTTRNVSNIKPTKGRKIGSIGNG